jgi:hypothetical protein
MVLGEEGYRHGVDKLRLRVSNRRLSGYVGSELRRIKNEYSTSILHIVSLWMYLDIYYIL